jgi:hypothetical protein
MRKILLATAVVLSITGAASAESTLVSNPQTGQAGGFNHQSIQGFGRVPDFYWLYGTPTGQIIGKTIGKPNNGGGAAKPLPHPISRPYGASISSGGVPGMVNNGNGWVSAQGSCC